MELEFYCVLSWSTFQFYRDYGTLGAVSPLLSSYFGLLLTPVRGVGVGVAEFTIHHNWFEDDFDAVVILSQILNLFITKLDLD